MQLEIDLAMVGRWFIASVTAMVIVGPAVVWFGGGWYAIAAGLQVGVIVAFVSFIQGRLYGPAAALAGIQVQIVSALAVFERIFDYLDMTPEEYDPPGRDRAAGRARRHRVRGRRLRVRRRRATCSTASLSRFAPARWRRSSGRRARARRRSPACPALLRSAARARSRRRSRRANGDAGIAAPRHRHRHAGDLSLPRHDRQQSALRQARRDRRRAAGGGACGEHRRLHRVAAATVTRRSSASAGTSSRAESASGSRSPGCCSRIRAS